jgi:ketosteroid isomerase-like protein
MDFQQRLQIRLAIEDLNTAFTRFLDHSRVAELVQLFTPDALYTHGARQSRGREEIHALFGARGARVRTARHFYSGLVVEIEDASHARGSCVCLTFAFDGLAPVRGTTPHLVADFEDRYLLCEDGRWRIAERRIHRIFEALDNPGPVQIGN